MKNLLILAAVAALGTSALAAADGTTPADQLAIATKAAPGLVRVEYTLHYDKGEPPHGAGVQYLCPNCGNFHYRDDGAELIRQERPMETPGFLVGQDQVIAPDIAIHERFITAIHVRHGEHVVPAQIAGHGQSQNAVRVQLVEPLPETVPLSFDPEAPGPYFSVNYGQGNGTWTITVKPLATSVSLSAQRPFVAMAAHSLIVNGSGEPVGMTMNPLIPIDDTWKGSPLSWSYTDTPRRRALLKELAAVADHALLHVTINFRSPRKLDAMRRHMAAARQDEDGSATERHAVGVLIDERRVLVLSHLDSKTTARLERISVYDAPGEDHAARFVATLSDYGALVVALDEPLPRPIVLASVDLTTLRHQLLLAADVSVAGTQRIAYYKHRRIGSFELGWRRRVYPEMSDERDGQSFLFDTEGALLVLPLIHREKVSVSDRWSGQQPIPTPALHLSPVLADLAAHSDPNNVPLSAADEARIAWLGVVLQPLNRDLARANQVSELTQDGQSGALVTHVYTGSPADDARIEPGTILLRIHAEGQPKPIDVQVEDSGFESMGAFPWDRYDEIPEQYFDQIPRPWPAAETGFTRTLTDLGFASRFTADFASDGEVFQKPFVVVESPPHFDSAPRHKSRALGLTVRDLTYESRHYLQMTPDDPGVIVSKVEPGSKSSIAGIKPYEIITHINDAPVTNAGQFERQVSESNVLRLSVKRMTVSRQVRLRVDGQEADQGP